MMFPNYYVGRIPLVEQQPALLNAEVKGLQAADTNKEYTIEVIYTNHTIQLSLKILLPR